MAVKTWYGTSALASVHQEMSETDPGTEAYASPVTGWIVSTGATNHAAFRAQTEQAASTFVDTGPPDGSIDTTNGDCLRSATTYSGTFASGNWNVHFACRANSNGGSQDGRMRCRLFRSANADGSGATEITSAQQQGGLVTNLATSATQVSTATFNPGSFSVTNEYIFVQLGWERTGAGGMTSSDVNMRIGNGSGTGTRVISTDLAAPAGRLEVSWAEFETPDQPSGRLEVSWLELETPDQPAGRLEASWAELEVPDVTPNGRLELSWTELEAPDPPGRLELSWLEFEIPDAGGIVRHLVTMRRRRGMRRSN